MATLAMTLSVVTAFARIHVFDYLAKTLICKFSSLKGVSFAIICITFITSMILANDMALLTFVPLTLACIRIMKKEKYAAFIISLQVIAANLGGMVTPFGNPQNMYLYSFFSIDPIDFMLIMLPDFILSIVLIALSFLFIPKESVSIENEILYTIDKKRLVVYSILFLIAIIAIFRIIPIWISLIIVLVCIVGCDYKVFLKLDYGLLLTFIFFFIFANNISRIESVNNFLSNLIVNKELLIGTISCQFISNVPSSILLSHFTTNYKSLLVAVNIGGLGTIIASLASLIALRKYIAEYGEVKKYLFVFSALNFSFLIILFVFSYIIL